MTISNLERKLYVACISPHENAVAQIAWINEKTYKIPSILDEIKKQPVDCNFEAETGWYIQQKAWNSAIDIAGQWQKYQPFSRTPALIKSEIALNYADKFTEAIQSLEEALLSNPNDISLSILQHSLGVLKLLCLWRAFLRAALSHIPSFCAPTGLTIHTLLWSIGS